MRRQFIVAALSAIALYAEPVSAQVARTGASTTTTSCASGITECDNNWSVRWFTTTAPGGYLAKAAIVPAVAGIWAPNSSTQQWIGAADNATLGYNTWHRYYFQTTFTTAISGNVTFGIAWDNKLMGAFVGGSIDEATGGFSGGTSLLPGISFPFTANGGTAGFCRDGDGVLPTSQYPNCVYNLGLTVNAAQSNTLTFIIEGDGETDGFLLGNADGANTPVIVDPTQVPEPATLSLLAAGTALLGVAYRRRMA